MCMDTRAFDFTVIGGIIGDLLAYLDVTLVVALTSIALGSLLGMALAGVKIAGSSWAKGLVNIYTYVMRCTPSIVLLFIVFYGLPVLVRGLFNYSINDMHRAVFAIITFALLFGAYISEVFRAAYQAVSRGQYEAAVSIGIKPWQAVWHVILPQAARIALPNFGNSVINLLKEGSLAYTIGLIDMLGRGNMIIAQHYGAYGIETYMACILIYWLLTLLLEAAFNKLELHFSKGTAMKAEKSKTAWFRWHWRGGEKHGLEY